MLRALALAVGLGLGLAPAASATMFHGAGVDDPQMTVTLRVSKAGVVHFDYAEIAVDCSNGDRVREPGAKHSTMLGESNRFSNTVVQDLSGGASASSSVKGRVRGRRAGGIVAYDLFYEGGECHSGRVRWKARHKNVAHGG